MLNIPGSMYFVRKSTVRRHSILPQFVSFKREKDLLEVEKGLRTRYMVRRTELDYGDMFLLVSITKVEALLDNTTYQTARTPRKQNYELRILYGDEILVEVFSQSQIQKWFVPEKVWSKHYQARYDRWKLEGKIPQKLM